MINGNFYTDSVFGLNENLTRRDVEPARENRIPSFTIDPQGSRLLLIVDSNFRARYALYQQKSNGEFVLLTPLQMLPFNNILIGTLNVLLPSQEADRVIEELPLREIDQSTWDRLRMIDNPITDIQILSILNNPLIMNVHSSNNENIRSNLVQSYNQRMLEYLQRESQNRRLTEQELRTMNALTTGVSNQIFTSHGSPVSSPQNAPPSNPYRAPVIDIEQERQRMRDIINAGPVNPRRNIEQGRPQNLISPENTISTSYEENLMGLHKQSYEALVSQLYGYPVQLPEFLILNGLRANFIPYEQIANIVIDRWIIDPLLQPWAGSPVICNIANNVPRNVILTIFGKNGITYLSKVFYNPADNKIYKAT